MRLTDSCGAVFFVHGISDDNVLMVAFEVKVQIKRFGHENFPFRLTFNFASMHKINPEQGLKYP